MSQQGAPDGQGPLDPGDAVRALAGIVLGGQSFHDVLTEVTRIAKRTIVNATELSVTLRNGRARTVTASGPLAQDADAVQYDEDEGPCLDALSEGRTVLVNDLREDARWAGYSPRAVDLGVAASMSVPLRVAGEWHGVFNCYATRSHAFDELTVATTEELATYAGIVLNNAGLYFDAATEAAQLGEALRSRAVIEQAKGVLMGQRRCNADEAFQILVRLSQEANVKLRDAAAVVVEQTIRG